MEHDWQFREIASTVRHRIASGQDTASILDELEGLVEGLVHRESEDRLPSILAAWIASDPVAKSVFQPQDEPEGYQGEGLQNDNYEDNNHQDEGRRSRGAEQRSIRGVVDRLIAELTSDRAQQLILCPRQGALDVRARREGSIEPWLSLPHALQAAVTETIKRMSSLDPEENQLPQDGRIRCRSGSEPVRVFDTGFEGFEIAHAVRLVQS